MRLFILQIHMHLHLNSITICLTLWTKYIKIVVVFFFFFLNTTICEFLNFIFLNSHIHWNPLCFFNIVPNLNKFYWSAWENSKMLVNIDITLSNKNLIIRALFSHRIAVKFRHAVFLFFPSIVDVAGSFFESQYHLH